MKRRIIKVISCTAVLSLVFLSSIAVAEHMSCPTKEKGCEELAISDMAKELNLTPEQKEQFREQKYQAKAKKIETRSKLRLKELALRHELEKKEVNRETIDRIVKEIKELHGVMLEQRVDSILKAKEILTPEQFEKFQSLCGKKMQKGHGENVKKFHFRKK